MPKPRGFNGNYKVQGYLTDILTERKQFSVKELAKLKNVTPAVVRNTLDHMQANGYLTRRRLGWGPSTAWELTPTALLLEIQARRKTDGE